jgi:hypothetical protein
MRGLDPRIHAAWRLRQRRMDCRVKPGNDDGSNSTPARYAPAAGVFDSSVQRMTKKMAKDVAGDPKAIMPGTRPSYDKSTKLRDPGGATPSNPDPRCDYVEINKGGMLDGGGGPKD